MNNCACDYTHLQLHFQYCIRSVQFLWSYCYSIFTVLLETQKLYLPAISRWSVHKTLRKKYGNLLLRQPSYIHTAVCQSTFTDGTTKMWINLAWRLTKKSRTRHVDAPSMLVAQYVNDSVDTPCCCHYMLWSVRQTIDTLHCYRCATLTIFTDLITSSSHHHHHLSTLVRTIFDLLLLVHIYTHCKKFLWFQ